CAEHNMQVCQPTTPAQIFHLLRRQMIRLFRKPLVILTPKSLLRNKEATSSLDEFSKGAFQTVIGESDAKIDPSRVKRVILCTGKVYYDLLQARRERNLDDAALVRIEQLYPFAHKAFDAEMRRYPNATQIVWCQDEPQNQGAWFYMQHHLNQTLRDGQKLSYSGRPASASPAAGYYDKHYAQQKELVAAAFGEARPRARKS
ncbi:MAG: 2-oxoglutarate dehydrogenase E1 component, partial [Quisquiliibacterium sp.]